MKSIEQVFASLKKKFKLANFHLASGGLPDVKGISDVDVVFMSDDYENLDHLFPDAQKDPRPDKNRCYYNFTHEGRPVSICASNDRAVMRSVAHRKNELTLNHFPLLAACAINNKLGGMKTEQAWASVLGLEGDPYEILARPTAELKKIAKAKEKNLQRVHSKLPK